MKLTMTKRAAAIAMCAMVLTASTTSERTLGQEGTTTAPAANPSTAIAAPTAARMTADQLDALVAPIALYPDALVAQVLGAATFPDQVAIAAYWMKQNSTLTGEALTQKVNQQTWDPSVKALTQFPDVLQNMAGNLVWTSNLGQAFHDQQADVMAAVQRMRAKAQSAGNLKSNAQIKVVQQTPQTIIIEPANPQVVYVPQYNPTIIYGTPMAVPLYTPPVGITTAAITFGTGVAVGAIIAGGVGYGGVIGGPPPCCGWGWNAWRVNWGWGWGGGGTVIYNNNTYISNNTWHGGGYPGYHPWGPSPNPNAPFRPGFPNGGGNSPFHPSGGSTPFGPNGGGGNSPFGPRTNPTPTPGGGSTPFGPSHGAFNGGGSSPFGGESGHTNPTALGSERSSGWGGDSFNRGGSHGGWMGGNGAAARASSNRGWGSMGHSGFGAQHFSQPRFSQPHFGGFRR